MPEGNAIELEVFRHLFASVAEEMGERLMRSAYSPNIKERRDFSCALFDANGEMLAQAAHIPVHLGSTPMAVRAVIDAFGLAPSPSQGEGRGEGWASKSTAGNGKVYVLNDPYAGGTHLPDITVVQPLYLPGVDPSGGPAFYLANRAHHADVGGISPGSLPISRHIDDEGLRITPRVLDDEAVDWIANSSRTPDERRGDLQAQLAALRVGAERLQTMAARYGLAVLTQRGNDLIAYTERIVRHLVESLPDGVYAFEDVLDDDGFGAVDIKLSCTLRIDGDKACLDFTGSADQVAGPVNAVRAIALSAVNYCCRCLLPADLPSNAGVMRPIEVLTRAGSVVDAAYPAPVAGGNVETSQRLVDVVFGALAKVLPDRVPAASCGSMNNLTFGGVDMRPGKEGRAFAYYETLAGGVGASPGSDGASALHTHMTNTLNTPIEAFEHAYPVLITRYAIRKGSGGAGQYTGGDGVTRAYQFDAPATVTLLTDRRTSAPYGLQGGSAGAPGLNTLTDEQGSTTELRSKATLNLDKGQTLTIHTPGGGGHGQT
ncbi:MAG: hydantoinase B/oxoprolinase family protein [Planctomycetota bacterium]